VIIYSPPQAPQTKSTIQISFNKADWHNVKDPKKDYSFEYLKTPKILSNYPKFGIVKDP